jgi:hypothetical protein
MLLAAEAYLRRHGPAGIFCVKLHHQNEKRCIFCEYRLEGAKRCHPERSEGAEVPSSSKSGNVLAV